ncbi:MAG: helix-turn-helix transcriptional regulator [Kosmotogaceae bacterium]|nr:helix-turn-helix transcriptional regulator [Kosmotogaceae bacterium]
MLAVVKTPRIKIEIKGKISKRLLDVLKEEYGSDVQIIPDEEDEKLDIFDTDWYKNVKEKLTPGKNMRIYRQNRGMTQKELGEQLGGIPRQHISNMERGIRAISKKVALRLSKIFDTSVDKFIG